jgi:hypothetical protein
MLGGRIILKWILKMEWVGMDWVAPTVSRDRWRALVNRVTNLRVPSSLGNLLIK